MISGLTRYGWGGHGRRVTRSHYQRLYNMNPQPPVYLRLLKHISRRLDTLLRRLTDRWTDRLIDRTATFPDRVQYAMWEAEREFAEQINKATHEQG